MQPQSHTEPRAITRYGVFVNNDTVLLQTTASNGDHVELAMSIDQARHLAFRLNEAVALAPQVGATN